MPTDRRTSEQDDQLLALMGLGAQSGKKSHYPELKRRLAELERVQALLDRAQDAIFVVSLPDETVEYRNESALGLRGGFGRRETASPGGLPQGTRRERTHHQVMFPDPGRGATVKILPLLTEKGVRRFEASFHGGGRRKAASPGYSSSGSRGRKGSARRPARRIPAAGGAGPMRGTSHLTATLVEIKDSYTGKEPGARPRASPTPSARLSE